MERKQRNCRKVKGESDETGKVASCVFLSIGSDEVEGKCVRQ